MCLKAKELTLNGGKKTFKNHNSNCFVLRAILLFAQIMQCFKKQCQRLRDFSVRCAHRIIRYRMRALSRDRGPI